MMKFIEQLCEKTVFALFALCFSFVSLYTPQVQTVHAGGGMTGGSTEVTQIANYIILGIQQGYQQVSAMMNTVVSTMTSNMWIKENILDGIGWALAKNIISSMTASIVNWINSGFQGSPAFITDMQGFLLGVADRTFGQYLEQLGGPFSFICAPFRLDVRIALAVYYESARANGAPNPTACTLSGAVRNIENFIDGTQNFVDAGGWNTWFTVTSQPVRYTPYGNLVEARAQATARIVNARGEEIKFLEFGQGFLSSKVCQNVADESGGHQSCTITTPGQTISSALNKSLGAGQDTLVQADEINEIIAALFGQLANRAITGAAGLLGLTGGTGYTYTGTPFTGQLSQSGFTSNPARLRQLIEDSRNVELNYQVAASDYETRLRTYSNNLLNPTDGRVAARNAADGIPAIIADSQRLVTTLDGLLAEYDAMRGNDVMVIQSIADRYFALRLHTQNEVDAQTAFWQNLLR